MVACPACCRASLAERGGVVWAHHYRLQRSLKSSGGRVQRALTHETRESRDGLRIWVTESPLTARNNELGRVARRRFAVLELRLPIQFAREAAHLSTDNLFDLLAGFRSEDSPSTTYTREFPFAATADYYDFLDFVLRNDLTASERARLDARSRNYAQFLRLLNGLERAEALRTRLLLD